MRKIWLLTATAMLANVCVFAQTSGEITGIVTDPSGSAVPNSVITLTSTATNATRQTQSTNIGLYTFTALPPGVYNLKVEHPGLRRRIPPTSRCKSSKVCVST